MSDWYMGELASMDGYMPPDLPPDEERAPLRIEVRPPTAEAAQPELPPMAPLQPTGGLLPKQVPGEFSPAAMPTEERPSAFMRAMPKVYDPLQKQQQEVANLAYSLTPPGAVSDIVEAYQNKDPAGLLLGVAGGIPGAGTAAKLAAPAVKAAMRHPAAVMGGVAAGATALSSDPAEASFLRAPSGKVLEKAKKLLGEGMGVRDIWDRTGLFQGADGIWRYEIPDRGARWRFNPAQLVGKDSVPLGFAFKHDELMKQAPWLGETDLKVYRGDPNEGGAFTRGSSKRPDKIELNLDYAHDDPRSVILHEGTHVIANRQELAAGANVNTNPLSRSAQTIYEKLKTDFMNPPSEADLTAQGIVGSHFPYKRFMKEYEAAKNADPALLDTQFRKTAAMQSYIRSAGEADARLTQFRANKSADYLANTPPPANYDVPIEKQIVEFNPGAAPQAAKKPTGFAPSPGFAPGSIAEVRPGKPILDASGAPIKGAAYTKQSRSVLDEIAAGEKGAGPMDLSGILRSDVPQVPMERYVPKHGVTDRLADAIANKKVQQGVRESVETGLKFGADKWYHNEPVRREFIKELGEVRGPIEYARFMDMVAATSPRSDVPTNIRNASFYYMMSGKKGLPEELPYPYGHVAQNLHRQNYATVTSPEGWDIFKNTKPASFSANLQGNLVPGTMDTHAFRNIGMRTKDPRFLETSVSAKYKQGTDPAKDTIVNKYGERTGDTVAFRPQALYEGGKLKMKDALQIPYFWSAKPRANEYGAAEKFYSEVGRDFKLPTADAQGAAWAGGGQLTGLGTVPTHTFPQLLNERILYTAKMRGEDPSKTLSDFIRKKAPLLVIPVAGAVGAAKMGGIAEQRNADGFD